MVKENIVYPKVGAFSWTGEVQALAVSTTATAATEITIPGRTFMFYATIETHIILGNAGIHIPTATGKNRCFPIPNGDTGGWVGPIYVPQDFYKDSAGEEGSLYVRALGTNTGVLYIAAVNITADSLNRGATSTSSTTTTTTTTTTSTTTGA